ncbi:hypothetical protein XENORESO_006303 [Xenotaenia resolanae]|uniref:Uncharacterized protein n=1 Tax=Xenotaenia resolanae TaxID=208358 RepID=A0ABV0WDA2_9TELE
MSSTSNSWGQSTSFLRPRPKVRVVRGDEKHSDTEDRGQERQRMKDRYREGTEQRGNKEGRKSKQSREQPINNRFSERTKTKKKSTKINITFSVHKYIHELTCFMNFAVCTCGIHTQDKNSVK